MLCAGDEVKDGRCGIDCDIAPVGCAGPVDVGHGLGHRPIIMWRPRNLCGSGIPASWLPGRMPRSSSSTTQAAHLSSLTCPSSVCSKVGSIR